MTDQLDLFEETFPVEACTFRQTAVVFTSLGGPRKGEQVYHVMPRGRDHLDWYANDYLPPEADARVMVRTVTCSPWEPA